MRLLFFILIILACNGAVTSGFAQPVTADPLAVAEARVLDSHMHAVRNGNPREWIEFPEAPESHQYVLTFTGSAVNQPATLQLTQQNVKQAWLVEINDQKIGQLHTDENPITAFFEIPGGLLVEGTNQLKVHTASAVPDDILVGDVWLHSATRSEVLNRCRIDVVVTEQGQPVPCRITVLQVRPGERQQLSGGSQSDSVTASVEPARDAVALPLAEPERLMTTGAVSTRDMAVRPGVIYCRGSASAGLPPGEYIVIAGRGPEYSIAETRFLLEPGQSSQIALEIQREVPTPGLISCDTHVHTLTHSGHGDATIEERMLTLAGEAIEMPIATDHNVHIDYAPLAREMHLDQYFTPVIGNEVTTSIGHWNVFPVDSVDVRVPNHRASSWDAIFRSIHETPGVQAVILNHARDIHSRYRPFDPRNHMASLGHNVSGWRLQANAMEIINSGAQQTDMLQLVDDWMGMLNAGQFLTPVGCSDSHDVARHFVGQARTYIVAEDSDAGRIDTAAAIQNFIDGKVTVSCGLLCKLTVNPGAGPGEIAPPAAQYTAHVEVLGPSWIAADQVDIYVNGSRVYHEEIPEAAWFRPGLKHAVDAVLPWTFQQDAFVVAVVQGPGVRRLHWPVARPYQPASAEWTPRCLGVSGAVWLDVDGDGQRSAARHYAARILQQQSDMPVPVWKQLEDWDTAVALHTIALLSNYDEPVAVPDVVTSLPAHVRDALSRYTLEWRNSRIAAAQ